MGNLGSLGRLLHLHLLHVVVQQQAVILVEGGVLVQLHLQGGQSLVQQSWSALPRPADITSSAVEIVIFSLARFAFGEALNI